MKNNTKDIIAATLYTAGPWELQGPKINKEIGNQTYWTIKPNPYKSPSPPYIVVGFYYPYSGLTQEQQLANAELIASAPILKEDNEILRKEIVRLKSMLDTISETLSALNLKY